MKRLAKWEKDLLPLSLITPKKWARQILRRNKLLLEAVKEDEEYDGNIGCPHCMAVGGSQRDDCDACQWLVVLDEGEAPCLSAEFNGLKHSDVCHYLYIFVSTGMSYGSENESYKPDSRISPKVITKFLNAHILWAERMIDSTYKQYAKKHNIKKPRKVKGVWTK